jgi:hypothetical protein
VKVRRAMARGAARRATAKAERWRNMAAAIGSGGEKVAMMSSYKVGVVGQRSSDQEAWQQALLTHANGPQPQRASHPGFGSLRARAQATVNAQQSRRLLLPRWLVLNNHPSSLRLQIRISTATIMTFKPALVLVDVQEDFCPPVMACILTRCSS